MRSSCLPINQFPAAADTPPGFMDMGARTQGFKKPGPVSAGLVAGTGVAGWFPDSPCECRAWKQCQASCAGQQCCPAPELSGLSANSVTASPRHRCSRGLQGHRKVSCCTGDTPAAKGHSQAWKAATCSSSFPHRVSPQLHLGMLWLELLQTRGGCSHGAGHGAWLLWMGTQGTGQGLGRDKGKGKFGCSPNEGQKQQHNYHPCNNYCMAPKL